MRYRVKHIRTRYIWSQYPISPVKQLCWQYTPGHRNVTGPQVVKFKSTNMHHIGKCYFHYDDVRMGAIASQITSLTIVYSTVYSGADQSKHQSSASLAFVWWIHRGPVNSPHKWPVTRKMFPFDDVIMFTEDYWWSGSGLLVRNINDTESICLI